MINLKNSLKKNEIKTCGNMYAKNQNPKFQNPSFKTLEIRVGRCDFRQKYKENFVRPN